MPSALLHNRVILRVDGADARHFLHNLLTNSVENLAVNQSCYAALLSPQGKIVSDMFVQPFSDTGFFLDAPEQRGTVLLQKLNLYKLRAAVSIMDISADHEIVQVWDTDDDGEADFFRSAGDYIPDPRLEALGGRWVRPREGTATSSLIEDNAYDTRRIALCIPEGGVDFLYDEHFPHDACLDQLHGIDFKKGCYVGQEIVSRMQHRGTARTRVIRVEASQSLPDTGTPVLLGGKTVGRLGSVSDTQGIALARLDRIAEGVVADISLIVQDIPVSPSLPSWATYDWPKAEAL